MNKQSVPTSPADLFTAQIADACVRLALPIRHAPPGIRPLLPGSRVAGRVLPVTHYGSVDIMLEALETAEGGDVLVIDNQGRKDEACIGDLTALEARAAALAGIVVWGCHRDTRELTDIGLPVFSLGPCSAGPTRLDARSPAALQSAKIGAHLVGRNDVVFADEDGILFIPVDRIDDVTAAAREIREKERQQASEIKAGGSLRTLLRFGEYLERRTVDPSYSFRKHLRETGGAVEE